jgi:hypothetical protein
MHTAKLKSSAASSIFVAAIFYILALSARRPFHSLLQSQAFAPMVSRHNLVSREQLV